MVKKSIHCKEYFYTAIYKPVKEGGYEVTVPVLSGLITYGRTFEEARKMVRAAIRCHMEGLLKEKQIIPREESILEEKVGVLL